MASKKPKQIDSAFINHLRQELLKQQDRRASYVRAKFTFVIGLFSFVALLSSQMQNQVIYSWLNVVVYLIPFIAVLFDFYILGGEFAVKRIRGFLKKYDHKMESEKIWDEHLRKWPKSFMRNNRFWTTIFIYIISIIFVLLNLNTRIVSVFEWIWFALWLVIIMVLEIYLNYIERLIAKSTNL